MLSKLIVYGAYFLKSSGTYTRSKCALYNLLDNPDSPQRKYLNGGMISLIVLSIFFLLYHIEHQASFMGGYFEQMILLVFIGEYLLRGWVYSDSYKIVIEEYEKALYLGLPFKPISAFRRIVGKEIEFMTSGFAVIDILAILPSYRPLPILQVFIIFRLFKLFRYSDSTKLYADILASKRFELATLLVFTCFLLFIASVSIYMFESPNSGSKINSLFDAFYWSVVTLATVGYGDITPHTTGGRWVAVILILTSIGVLSFFTSILISAFSEKMHTLRETRVYADLKGYKNFILICGFGRVGQEVARHLNREGQKFVIIDRTPAHVELAKRLGYPAIHADASKNDVLLNAGIGQSVAAILCITGDDVVNVYVTLSSRHLDKNVRIISRANRHDNVNKLYQAGADHVIRPFEVAGMLAAEFVGQPVAFEAISGILQNQTDITMETVLISERSPLDNQRIDQLELTQNKLTLLGVISDNPIHHKHKNKFQVKQQLFYFNPEGRFVLRHGDMLVLLGRKYGIDHFRDHAEQRRLLQRKPV